MVETQVKQLKDFAKTSSYSDHICNKSNPGLRKNVDAVSGCPVEGQRQGSINDQLQEVGIPARRVGGGRGVSRGSRG